MGWIIAVSFAAAPAAIRHVTVSDPGNASTSLVVWIYFVDKPIAYQNTESVSPRALARRRAAGFSQPIWADYPIDPEYLRRVETAGGKLRHCVKWENAASFELSARAVTRVKKMPFVKHVACVRTYCSKKTGFPVSLKKRTIADTGGYGTAFGYLAMLSIPQAHEYLRYLNSQDEPGKGVRIAFFDSGFRLDHRCFRHLQSRGAVKGTWDFIDRDSTVADPDSVTRNFAHPLNGNDIHGSEVFSLVAAYDPPYYCGSAWGADFLLARTEDTYFDSTTRLEHELHTEEDNWAAAVVWAESLGVDIISSSLGYRYDFQDTIIIVRNDGLPDTIVDYPKSDLDGRTTIVSRAARGAIERGVLIVNAVGNEQEDGDTSLSAPADVDGVIAVGSVSMGGSLSYFSSLGPSATGLMKPDVVAPGQQISLPDILNPGSTTYRNFNSGTSFSTPFVAGVCALVRQAFPHSNAQEVRDRLYKFCRLLPSQTIPDDAYGRGIPDAIRSCMQWEDEVFLSAMDTRAEPLADAFVVNKTGDTLGRTAEDGTARFHLSGEKPAAVALVKGGQERAVVIDAVPCRKEVAPCSLIVSIRTDDDKPLPSVMITYRRGAIEDTLTGDTLGNAVITSFFPSEIELSASKPGYSKSEAIDLVIGEQSHTHLLYLKAARRPFFEAYPTVVKRYRGDQLIIRFAPKTDGNELGRPVNVSVRSVTGSLVWKKDILTDGTPITLRWDGLCSSRKRAAPGTYFLVLSCDDERFRTKFIIAE